MTTPVVTGDAKRRASWVQTDRQVHELWARMSRDKPAASAVLHWLVGNVGDDNAVVASMRTISEMTGLSLSSVQRAIAYLDAHDWLQAVQLGKKGTTQALVLNDAVAWTRSRDDLRHSRFRAIVLASSTDQALGVDLDTRRLTRIPRLFADEQQMPAGDGLPPVSQPALPSLETPLPTRRR